MVAHQHFSVRAGLACVLLILLGSTACGPKKEGLVSLPEPPGTVEAEVVLPPMPAPDPEPV